MWLGETDVFTLLSHLAKMVYVIWLYICFRNISGAFTVFQKDFILHILLDVDVQIIIVLDEKWSQITLISINYNEMKWNVYIWHVGKL